MVRKEKSGFLAKVKALYNSLVAETDDPITQWLMCMPMLGALSKVGQTITEADAVRVMAVYACIRVIASEIGASPLHFMRTMPNGGKERVHGGMADLLRFEPNPEMTASDFKKTMTFNLELWGNGYAEVQRNRLGEVVGLWPIPSWRVIKERDLDTRKLYYRVAVQNGEVILDENRMLHLRGLGDGVVGMRFVSLARDALGLAIAGEEYGSRFFENGALASGIATYPRALSQEALDNFKKSFKESYEGLSNAQRVMFLEEDMKFQQLTIPNDAAQFLETRSYQMHEVCRFFGVPPHKIAILDRATFSNIEHQSMEFDQQCIYPRIVQWEEELRRVLLTPEEKEQGYFFKFNLNSKSRVALVTKTNYYNFMRQNGVMNANDIREMEDMNPIPAEEGGDAYLVNGNMIPLSAAMTRQPDVKESADEE